VRRRADRSNQDRCDGGIGGGGGVLSAPLNSGSILSRAIDPLSANNTASRRPTGRPSSPRRKPQWLF